jgi:glycerate kinase
MTRVLVAPDKFKGSLSAAEVAAALAAGITAADSSWTVRAVPIADGGDGTVAAALAAGWSPVSAPTVGATGQPHTTQYAVRGSSALIELASAVGLATLPGGQLDPLGASTFGLGTVIKHALEAGAGEIIIGVGGSASTDGGAGMLQALGARILDRDGIALGLGGGALADADQLDLSGLHPAVSGTRFSLASDVDNPLLGPLGAAAVYGPQKGAGPDDVELLDTALDHWADVVAAATGTDHRDAPGAGAAGGVGFGLIAALGAVMRPGADLVFDLVGLHDALTGCDLVVTGEGSLDAQTLHGKAPAAVAAAARAKGIPAVAVAGQVRLTPGELQEAGISAAYALVDEQDRPGQALSDPGPLLVRIGAAIARGHLALPSAHPADEEGPA